MDEHLSRDKLQSPELNKGKQQPDVMGPDPVTMTLWVNGKLHELTVAPSTTLAEALRGPLELTGTKIACNQGACAACSVWLDDMVVAACSILAIEVGDRMVTTIEGLGSAEQLHPVQAAFIEHDAVQCGFCTPGMIMSCAALLARHPRPRVEDIEQALSGHICRCGTYPHILHAMLSFNAPESAPDE